MEAQEVAKILLSIPNEILEKIDKYKSRKKIKRNQFFINAVENYFVSLWEQEYLERKKKAVESMKKTSEEIMALGIKNWDPVAEKWYYKKDERDLKNASIIYNLLKSENNIFFAPDLLIYELLNIYRTKVELDNEKIKKIILELYDLIVILGVSKNIFLKAFLNSRNLNISFYDSIYLSLSGDLDAILITADKKLFESAKEAGRSVLMLSN